ncbi:Adenine deaminase [compost metagenome]
MVPEDLLKQGHMNEIVRRTIAEGIDPVEAIQMVTINPATHFGFGDIGVLAPGKRADLVVITNLQQMTIDGVYLAGTKAAAQGELLLNIPSYIYPESVKSSVKRAPVKLQDLYIEAKGNQVRARAIEVIPDQNLTGGLEVSLKVQGGIVQPDLAADILPLLVIERHEQSGLIGKTFVRGMKLREGAIAQSVAHDTHNIIVTGTNYEDMKVAANRVIAMNGGICMIRDGKVIGDLPLRIGGLMSDELTGKEMSAAVSELHRLAEEELGCTLHVPFMHLSFLSLVTSPKWKITDLGLIDAENFKKLPTILQ